MGIRMLSAAALAALVCATAAGAQSARIPAEVPPAGYSDSQYVDSNGCVFVRAGFNGTVTWVPRYGNDRQPMCGFMPTGGAGATQVADSTVQAPAAPPPVTVSAPPAQVGSGIRVRTSGGVEAEVLAPPRSRSRAPATAYATPRAPVLPEPAAPQVTLSDSQGYATGRRRDGLGRAFCGLNPCVTTGMPGFMHGANATEPRARSPQPTVSTMGTTAAIDSRPQNGGGLHTGGGRMTNGQYVQVGVYGSASNASAAAANLQANGMPVAMARAVAGGSEYRVILAGPFADAGQVSAALRHARALGYTDAFIR